MPKQIETSSIHSHKEYLEAGNTPLVSPIHQSVKYVPKNYQHLKEILANRRKGYLYSRVTNPTVRELEVLLAQLQGREDAICLGSGIAALATTMIALAKSGDHILMFRESYKPTRFLQNVIMSGLGVRTSILGIGELAKIEELFRSDPPSAVIIESPTNPCLRVPDLRWFSSLCQHAKSTLILDNTFSGFHHHGSLPIDIYIHSLTKHAGGHSDAMGGAIIANSRWIEKIVPVAITLGATLDPHAAWLISRGMKTYSLRTRTSSDNAKAIALHLSKHPAVEHVKYPGLPTHPDFKIWRSQQNGDGGSIVTFDLKAKPNEEEKTLEKFIDSLKIFSLTTSIGCVESLVAPCLCLFADDLAPSHARSAGITGTTVRLALGIENVKDLVADLDQALATIRTST